MAPNVVTLIGLVFPMIVVIYVGLTDPAFNETNPWWAFILFWFSTWWYQTIDSVDGKHARATDNCSPIGQLLDHNLDQISFTSIYVSVCATLQINDITRMMMIMPGVLSAHYSIEYRTHFTNFHSTVVGLIGATEQLIFIQIGLLTPLFFEEG